MSKSVFKAIAVLALVPFIVLMVIGRLPESMAPGEFVFVNEFVTFGLAICVAFLGAYASRKAGYMNLNAVHGIIGTLLVSMMAFTLIDSWPVALVSLVIAVPVMYIAITATKLGKVDKSPSVQHPNGISDVTVWSFVTGKNKGNGVSK